MLMNILELLDELKFIKVPDYIKKAEFDYEDLVKFNKEINELALNGELIFLDEYLYSKKYYQVLPIISLKNAYYIKVQNSLKMIDTKLNLYHDDLVLVNEKYEFVSIYKRSVYELIGNIKYLNHRFIFIPDDIKFKNKYQFTNYNKLKANTKVAVKIIDHEKNLIEVKEEFGLKNSLNSLIKSVLYKYNIKDYENKQYSFPEIDLDKEKDRKDLTSYNFFTIDGVDAKDFDDAIYVEKHKQGYDLYVAIADVSYYIKEDSKLDLSARAKVFSIYYLNNVSPMLPPILADDLCSLKEGVNRLVLCLKISYDNKLNEVDFSLNKAIIKSKKRFTYDELNSYFENPVADIVLKKEVDAAYELFKLFENAKQNSLLINEEEYKYQIKNNRVIDKKLVVSGEANKLIETFMIKANNKIAQYLKDLALPCIYRHHPSPKKEKIDKLINYLRHFDYEFKNPHHVDLADLNLLINNFKDSEFNYLISKICLRTMEKAIYSHNESSHYALSLNNYLHFTSPIRRYADLIVHRMIHKYLFNANYDDYDRDLIKNEIIALSISEKEKMIMNIDRDFNSLGDAKMALSMVGQKFTATVSSFNAKYIFLRIHKGIEVIANNEGYNYDLENEILYNNKRVITIGTKLRVKLVRVSLETFKIYVNLL